MIKQRKARNPSPEEIKQVFPEDPQPAATGATSGLDVYIDGSGSMHGFLDSPRSVFRQTLSDLLLSATQSGFDLKVFRFSSTIEPVTGSPMSVLQNAGFYTGADTPLASLLAQIRARPDRTAIAVSDLVLSSKKEDSQGLVKAMAALAGGRPEIQLLGFRSNFRDDKYKSEYSSIRQEPGQRIPAYAAPRDGQAGDAIDRPAILIRRVTIPRNTGESSLAGALPGEPCMVQATSQKNVSIASSPGPRNQYQRLVLRIKGEGHIRVVIDWSLQ